MGTQLPEWKMEKQRFYVELPGDMYADGHFMNRIKGNQIIKDRDSRMPYEDMLLEHQVTTELQVIDPNDSCVFSNPAPLSTLVILLCVNQMLQTERVHVGSLGRRSQKVTNFVCLK